MAHRSMSMYTRTPTLKEGTPTLREEFLRELLDIVHERYNGPSSGKQSKLSVNKNIIRQASLITVRTRSYIQRKSFARTLSRNESGYQNYLINTGRF